MSFPIAKTGHVQAAATPGVTPRPAAQAAERAPAPARDRLSLSAALRNPAAYNRAVLASIGEAKPMTTTQKVTAALVVGGGAAAGFLLGRHLVARGVLLPYIGVAAPTLMGAVAAAAGHAAVGRLKER